MRRANGATGVRWKRFRPMQIPAPPAATLPRTISRNAGSSTSRTPPPMRTGTGDLRQSLSNTTREPR